MKEIRSCAGQYATRVGVASFEMPLPEPPEIGTPVMVGHTLWNIFDFEIRKKIRIHRPSFSCNPVYIVHCEADGEEQ